ncbi:response regulator [Paenibacillus senegalensis]|uniref:response regulator n=1 Tax=Paenibacillus senegalensis TaxID=1465766 RepID=UPI0002896428|nr:response regulator transcription factor [Paenibacillus senegalensis]
MPRKSVLIVDDDPLICQSLQVLLSREQDLYVSGTANNGQEAIDCCKKLPPDLILMDIRMPGMDGIQATREIKQQWPHIQIMMLTTFQDEQNIRSALQAGAAGYMLKSTKVSGMAEQLRALGSGSTVLDSEVIKHLVPPTNSELDQLTPRERDIVERIAQGCSNREIAGQLFISEGTVRNTLSTILEKLQLRDRTQLAIYYWKRR